MAKMIFEVTNPNKDRTSKKKSDEFLVHIDILDPVSKVPIKDPGDIKIKTGKLPFLGSKSDTGSGVIVQIPKRNVAKLSVEVKPQASLAKGEYLVQMRAWRFHPPTKTASKLIDSSMISLDLRATRGKGGRFAKKTVVDIKKSKDSIQDLLQFYMGLGKLFRADEKMTWQKRRDVVYGLFAVPKFSRFKEIEGLDSAMREVINQTLQTSLSPDQFSTFQSKYSDVFNKLFGGRGRDGIIDKSTGVLTNSYKDWVITGLLTSVGRPDLARDPHKLARYMQFYIQTEGKKWFLPRAIWRSPKAYGGEITVEGFNYNLFDPDAAAVTHREIKDKAGKDATVVFEQGQVVRLKDRPEHRAFQDQFVVQIIHPVYEYLKTCLEIIQMAEFVKPAVPAAPSSKGGAASASAA